MRNGVAALGIDIPKRAPAVAIKHERDALIAESSPYFIGNAHAVLSKFKCETRDAAGKIIRGDPITLLMVYVAYANHVNGDTGEAFPSYGRLSTILGISTKTIGRALHELCDRGLLKIDRRMRTKSGKGYINVVRVVHAPGLTTNDERSIASYPQRPMRHLGVPSRNGHHDVSHAGQSVGINGHDPAKRQAPVSDNQNVQLRNGQPACPRELSLTKTIQDTSLKTAEQAISLWLTYAWKHGQHQPIADDDDLATAHNLVARSITAEQLEHAIIQDPEADSLNPVVRHLLA